MDTQIYTHTHIGIYGQVTNTYMYTPTCTYINTYMYSHLLKRPYNRTHTELSLYTTIPASIVFQRLLHMKIFNININKCRTKMVDLSVMTDRCSFNGQHRKRRCLVNVDSFNFRYIFKDHHYNDT